MIADAKELTCPLKIKFYLTKTIKEQLTWSNSSRITFAQTKQRMITCPERFRTTIPFYIQRTILSFRSLFQSWSLLAAYFDLQEIKGRQTGQKEHQSPDRVTSLCWLPSGVFFLAAAMQNICTIAAASTRRGKIQDFWDRDNSSNYISSKDNSSNDNSSSYNSLNISYGPQHTQFFFPLFTFTVYIAFLSKKIFDIHMKEILTFLS